MSISLLHELTAATLASSIAVLLVGSLRKLLRRVAGARVAYWLWLIVPVTALAAFLPAPTYTGQMLGNPLPNSVSEVLSTAALAGWSAADYVNAVLATWLLGVLLMSAVLMVRQRAFVRSLTSMGQGPDHILRSDSIVGPMLIGAWRARVVVPLDFEARYTEEERVLMLAHERAHLERSDTLINGVAATWLCLFWFNPLMYWALGRLHFDQELACDALVVSRYANTKRRYANTLLKAQMTTASAWLMPVGCHWTSSHPLKERIAVLKYSSPGRARRLGGIAFTVALTISAIYAVSFASGIALAQKPASDAAQTFSPPSGTSNLAANGAESPPGRINIDVNAMEVREILRLIADASGHNIVVNDRVKNTKLTLHFADIPWTDALNVVVMGAGLVATQSGNITFVDVAHK